jgi:hypothetical protein
LSYPGGKEGEGVFHRLINMMPPHDVYIEPFLGGGAIMRHKRPAKINWGIDIDKGVTIEWLFGVNPVDICIRCTDAVKFLKIHQPTIDTFIYCDPPYVMESRASGRIYNHEYTNAQHIELLELLVSLKSMVMISGYRHSIYDDALSSWRRVDYMAPTRGGLKPESAWMNYPEPTELHDYRYLGINYRDRERIKKKKDRWVKNLMAMPVLERNSLLDAMNSEVIK